MMMRSALYQTNTLCWIFLQCQLTETTVRGQTCHSTRTYYPDSEPTRLCSFFLMLRAQRRNNKYQFYSLWLTRSGLFSVKMKIHKIFQNSIVAYNSSITILYKQYEINMIGLLQESSEKKKKKKKKHKKMKEDDDSD